MALLLDDPVSRATFIRAARDASGWGTAASAGVARLDAILASIGDEDFPGAILPRRDGNRMVYYALAETPGIWRTLRPLLVAFAGVTLSDFTGRLVPLNSDSAFEKVLIGHGFREAGRFSAHGERTRETALLGALTRMRQTLSRADRSVREVPRTTAQVLRDFRMALATGDREAAEPVLAFLRDNMRLDALNLAFLEVQLGAAFGQWASLLDAPFFASVCRTRRPPAVTAALVEAVYRVRLAPFEAAGDVAGALTAFRSQSDAYGELFSVLPPALQPPAGKAFLLSGLTSEPPNLPLIAAIRSMIEDWSEADQTFARSLLSFQHLEAPVPPSPALPASSPALWTPGQALDMAGDAGPATVDRARAILIDAAMVATLAAYRVAVEYLGRLDAAARERALTPPALRATWREVSRFAANGHVPGSWSEWARLLPDLDFAEARGWAERAVEEWPIERSIRSQADVGEVVLALQKAATAHEDRVADALPHLVAWVQADPDWPNPLYRPLYEQVAELLLLGAGRTESTLRALNAMVDGLLAMDLDEAHYRRLLGDLSDALNGLGGVNNVDALIDLAELTVIHPCRCPDGRPREDLWGAILSQLQPLGSRLTYSQLALLRDLAEVLGLAELVAALATLPREREAGASSVPRGLVVAVYTLTETVVDRVRRAVNQLYPNIEVRFVHDHVASPPLLALARTADLFVIAWSSAKHAATDAIKHARSPALPIRYANGGGSSSILREIQCHIESNTT